MQTGIGRQLDPTRRSKTVEDFERSLRHKIIGQDAAVDAVVEIFQMFTAGLNPPHRPIGNLLFLGPTGTGKTRVVEALAETLSGSDRGLIRIDCGEFQHSHEIAKLIGSPPGYLGHRETHPALTQEAINQHHTDKAKLTPLLVDEIEKASDSLWQLLLGILDKATLTLGDNRRVDLSSCFIIMTSNLGAAEMRTMIASKYFSAGTKVDVSDKAEMESLDEKVTRTAIEAAKRKFSPEFMNRIDKSVVFKTLNESHLEQILELELEAIQRRIFAGSGNSQFVFSCSTDAKTILLHEGTNIEYGARHLKRALERRLVFPLSNLIATDQIRIGDGLKISVDGDRFIFTVESENTPMPIMAFSDVGLHVAAEGFELDDDDDGEEEQTSVADLSLVRATRKMNKAEENLKRAKELQTQLEELLHPKPKPDQKE